MLYQITVRGIYADQAALNVFHYNSSGTPAAVSGSFGLADSFGAIPDGTTHLLPADSPLQHILNCLSNGYSIREVEVMALYDEADFYVAPLGSSYTGGISGSDAMSPFNSYGFYTNRVTRAIRRGFKRFAGVNEASVGTYGAIISSQFALLETAAAAMSATITYDDEGNTLTYVPAVLSYEKYTAPSGHAAYRPWPTLSAQLSHAALGIVYTPYPTVRSQVSRQVGRGA